MNSKYTEKVNIQLLIAGLKKHEIKKVIVSPGTTNVMFVASLQQDSWFELFSAPDERSAAYMACGMAYESGEPIVLSCTGATASRNYMPGLTEAFYRKLPVLAVTSMMGNTLVNNNLPQILDRTVIPNDIANLSVTIPDVSNEDDIWKCTVLINQALLELRRKGGGPVHINLLASFTYNFETASLPNIRKISRYIPGDIFPKIKGNSTIAIFAGVHVRWSEKLVSVVEQFCEKYDAFVITDQTSGYKGKYAIQSAIMAAQEQTHYENYGIDLLIDIGEVSGDYYQLQIKEVWRVSSDGEVKDRFKKLRYVFEMTEEYFFSQYNKEGGETKEIENYYRFKNKIDWLRDSIPELPFSNIWIAEKLAHSIPKYSILHLGILNSLRAWNFFEVDKSISSICNVGGFGIDGCLSTALGASIVSPNKLCFCVLGDLAFFYDMNSIGNRYLGKNLRILLINNGKGTEFRHYSHPASMFGKEADDFIAAAGHYGNKSRDLVKHYSEDLGFEYLSASSKEEFMDVYQKFVDKDNKEKPILFEVFTDSENESSALKTIRNIEKGNQLKVLAKSMLGEKNIQKIYSVLKK